MRSPNVLWDGHALKRGKAGNNHNHALHRCRVVPTDREPLFRHSFAVGTLLGDGVAF